MNVTWINVSSRDLRVGDVFKIGAPERKTGWWIVVEVLPRPNRQQVPVVVYKQWTASRTEGFGQSHRIMQPRPVFRARFGSQKQRYQPPKSKGLGSPWPKGIRPDATEVPANMQPAPKPVARRQSTQRDLDDTIKKSRGAQAGTVRCACGCQDFRLRQAKAITTLEVVCRACGMRQKNITAYNRRGN